VELAVRDRGLGIPAEKRGQLFECFSQVQANGHRDGLGLGLYISRQIVEAPRQRGPALLVRFGTVLADAAAVAHTLAERYDVLVADLARLGDKVECGLSVLWDPPSTQGEDPALSTGAALAAQDPRARYLQARLAAHRLAAAARERARALARELGRVLSGHTLERRCTIPLVRDQ
jgi:hypothetical protein